MPTAALFKIDKYQCTITEFESAAPECSVKTLQNEKNFYIQPVSPDLDKKKAYLKFKEVRVCLTETGGTRGVPTQEDVCTNTTRLNKQRK